MPTYSFGEDSPMKFEISDKLADLYNQAVDEFLDAQQRFNQKFGRVWDPKGEPIELRWNKKQRHAWNQFAKIFDATIQRDGPFHANDIMDDFLVENVAESIAKAAEKFKRGITFAVAAGVVYGLLRGR